jgi:hypothetical protein
MKMEGRSINYFNGEMIIAKLSVENWKYEWIKQEPSNRKALAFILQI